VATFGVKRASDKTFCPSTCTYCSTGVADTRAQIKDPEEVINKMYGYNIDIKVTLSGSFNLRLSR